MAKFVKVILFLLLTVAFHSIAGNVSTAKVVDEQERAITYAMRQHGEISAPDLPGKPVAELNNLQSHQISVTRIQRVQLGEYFFSLKNACRGVSIIGGISGTGRVAACALSSCFFPVSFLLMPSNASASRFISLSSLA